MLLCAFPCSASLEGTTPGDLQQRVKFFGSVLFKDFNETRSVSLLLKVCVFFLSGRIFAVCLACVFSLLTWLLWLFVLVRPGAGS